MINIEMALFTPVQLPSHQLRTTHVHITKWRRSQQKEEFWHLQACTVLNSVLVSHYSIKNIILWFSSKAVTDPCFILILFPV